ncbi:hypothetical protein F4859DRAFT_345020 [Xylaria cf. heliscus]|nr:hypothetical protein F4859DRAFT_345020 [Xylaria cf. heliscus]
MATLLEPQTPWFDLCQRLETENVNPQLSSPLYNCIPAEIRNLIFEFAVTEPSYSPAHAIKPDDWVQQSHDPAPAPEAPRTRDSSHPGRVLRPSELRLLDHGFDWLRFDNTEPLGVEAALLLTCRQVYIETCTLPLLQSEQRFYCHRGPLGRALDEGDRSNVEEFVADWLSNPAPGSGMKQKDLVRSVRLFTQQFWLEDTFLQLVNAPAWFVNLEHLQITLRRGDWWEWEREDTLRINPFRGNCGHAHTVDLMRRDMTTETENLEFTEGAWGRAFSQIPKLKSLTIDFETAANKRDEMGAIVAWALGWRFPLPGGRYLSTEGRPASKISWRGLPPHWSNQCPLCGNRIHYRMREDGCSKCSEIRQLLVGGYGPQLLVWTCLWKPVQDL